MEQIVLPPKGVIEFITGKRSSKEQELIDKLIKEEVKVKEKVLKRDK